MDAMQDLTENITIRWADLDPNFHLRHSVYYDICANARLEYLAARGINMQFMQQHQFGPILFREEAVFKREILLADTVSLGIVLLKANKDFSRWTVQHHLIKNNDTLAAIITVEGAWIDVLKRKLMAPPAEAQAAFESMPKNELFEWAN
jgi:acyl-CoA thioester hydrolase